MVIEKKRKQWIDALRAIAILMVMYNHCVQEEYDFLAFTKPITIPSFFAISGYLFRIEGRSFISFVKTISKGIVIPWLFLGSFVLIPVCVVKGNWVEHYYNLFSGGGIWWFLPCFVFGELIFFFLNKCIPSLSLRINFSFIFFFVGILLSNNGLLNTLSLNTAIIVQFFFTIGATFKDNESHYNNLKIFYPIAFSVLYISLCLCNVYFYPGLIIDVHYNTYFDIPFNVICIVVGVFTLFTIISRIKTFPKWLIFIGQNTLVIYMLHNWVRVLLVDISGRCNMFINCVWIEATLLTMLSLVICCVICFFLNKYFPILVGK